MTEREREDWFEKYLGDVESSSSERSNDSVFEYVPRKFIVKKWVLGFGLSLPVLLALSCFLAFYNVNCSFWLLTWLSNAFLSFSLGVIASIILLLYTSARDRSIAFYSAAIPVLEERYNNLHKAYFEYTFEINKRASAGDYIGCYEAWNINSDTCFVILNFVKYLNEKIPYKTESLKITNKQIEELQRAIREVHAVVQKELSETGGITEDTLRRCNNVTYCGSECLKAIYFLIPELKLASYGVQFGKYKKHRNNT